VTTTRTVRAEQPGPVLAKSKTQSLDLTVLVEPGREYGEIVITTRDDEGSSADIVKTARLQARENQISIEVDENAGGVTVVQTGRGRYSSISVGRNYGMVAGSVVGGMVMSGGRMVVVDNLTVVDGRVVSGNATVIEAGSPVSVTAYVPAGSSISASAQAGDVETSGRLAQVAYSAQSGDAHLDEVGNVNVSTQSGDITIANLTGTALLNSMSGDITVHGRPGANATARTMSGDVRGTGGLNLDGSSMSGRVRNR
jgi:hypothetical protein